MNKNKLLKIIGIAALIIAVPITVFIAQKRQEVRQRAEAPTGQIQLYFADADQSTPRTQALSLAPAAQVTLDLLLDTNNGTNLPVSGFDILFSYGSGLTLTNAIEQNGAGSFNTPLFSNVDAAAKTFHFGKVNNDISVNASGLLRLGRFTFTAAQTGNSSLSFVNNLITVPGYSDAVGVRTTPISYTIAAPSQTSVTVLSPNAQGLSFQIGSPVNIGWAYDPGSSGTTANVPTTITLTRADGNIRTNVAEVTRTTSRQGLTNSFVWTLPSNIPAGTNYRFNVEASPPVSSQGNDIPVNDESDFNFTITNITNRLCGTDANCPTGYFCDHSNTPPQGDMGVCRPTTDGNNTSVQVTSPNGGEQWAQGTLHQITWTYNAGSATPRDVPTRVQLKRVQQQSNGTDVLIGVGQVMQATSGASSGTVSNNSLGWIIPGDTPVGSNYKIAVEVIPPTSPQGNNIPFNAISDNTFSITTPGPLYRADLNQDHRITIDDFNIWLNALRNPSSGNGDINGDNTVDILDFNIWYTAMQTLGANCNGAYSYTGQEGSLVCAQPQ